MITREEATSQIIQAKKAKEVTFEQIANPVGRDRVSVAAALLGQASMTVEEANAAVEVLGLGPEVAAALRVQEWPDRHRT